MANHVPTEVVAALLTGFVDHRPACGVQPWNVGLGRPSGCTCGKESKAAVAVLHALATSPEVRAWLLSASLGGRNPVDAILAALDPGGREREGPSPEHGVVVMQPDGSASLVAPRRPQQGARRDPDAPLPDPLDELEAQ